MTPSRRSFRIASLLIAAAWFLPAAASAQVTPCESANFCSSVPNDSGAAAVMSSNGQCVVADNNFTISASPVPNTPGLFFYSEGQAGMGNGVPFGRGLRCVGGHGFSVFRLPVNTAKNNTLSRTLDFNSLPSAGSIVAGSTWNFQAWFRDTNAMGMQDFNLSDGLQVTFIDSLPEVSFSLPTRSISEAAGTALVKVELSATSFVDVEVPFKVGGNASNPDDYTVVSSPLVIPAGQVSMDIVVTLVEDGIFELDENITFTLTDPTNAVLGGLTSTVLKIQEDDAVPSVSFATAASLANEGDGSTEITILLSAPSALDVDIPFSLGGTAQALDDYSVKVSPIRIPAGQTSVALQWTPVDETLGEIDETVVFTLGAPTTAVLGSPSVHTATLLANDTPSVNFGATGQTLGEGAGPTAIAVLLSNPSSQSVTIAYDVTGTATQFSDFGVAASPLILPAGQTSGMILLTPNDDLVDEGDETAIVTITGATNAVLGGALVHTATLVDNDVATVNFAAAGQSLGEGAGATGITVSLSNLSTQNVTVTYAVSGTASETGDFGIAASPLVIPAGQMSGVIALTANDDLIDEGDETAIVTITGATNAALGGALVHTATLVDDDVATVNFAAAGQNLGEAAGATGIVVNLSNESTQNVTVTYAVSGTASETGDFGIAASPLVIPAGQMSGVIALTANDDLIDEGDETAIVTITGATNAALGGALVHTATLVDDDVATVEFAAASQNLGEAAGATGIVVNLSNESTQNVTVTYAVSGTASETGDFGIAASPLVIPAGQMSGVIALTANDDLIDEGDETAIVTITGATNAALGGALVHTATLVDDDVATVEFAAASQNLGEAAGATGIVVNLSNESTQNVTVTYAVSGTASETGDFGIAASPLVIPAGQMSGVIALTANDDLIDEGDETAIVTITGATNAALGGALVHTATLVDDDVATVNFAAASQNLGEAAGATGIVVNLSNESTQSVTATYAVSGTASETGDFGIAASPLVIPAGQMSGVIALTANDDLIDEGDETAIVTITGATNAALGGALVHTATLVDDDVATVNFAAASQNLGEAAGATGIVVNLSNESTQNVTVTYAVSGTASETGDFGIAASPLVIPAGQMSGVIALTANDDLIDEGDETAIVTITGATNAALGGALVHTATLVDDDVATVNFAAAALNLGEGSGSVGLTVNLSNASTQDVSVMYSVTGTAMTPEDYGISVSPLVIPAGQVSGDITLTAVDDMLVDGDETVTVTITSSTNASLGGALVMTATLIDDDFGGFVSDDFNQCALDGIWTLTDPQNDAVLETRGAGSNDAQLLLSIPAGTHLPFNSITAPRVTQATPDDDFELEVKFDSLVTGSTRDQGVLVLEDEFNWVRFDFFSNGSNLFLYAADTVAGSTTPKFSMNLGPTATPTWMRINRTGDVWTLYWSLNGTSFVQATNFASVLNVSEAGVYVGNSGPAHTMIVDYVFETSAPVVPEDGPVIGEIGRTLMVNIAGNGSVVADLDQPVYYCSEDVELTAIPDPGWMFDHWEMDLTGMASPDTVNMSADRTVTAVFTLAPLTVQFAAMGQSVGEGAGATPITVNLSAMSAVNVTVMYSVTGTAENPADYSITASPLVILAGQTSANLTLSPVDDMLVESGETVIITLTGAMNAALGATQVHTATLIDNDGVALTSDDFNKCTLDGIWSLTDPQADATLTTVGAGSDDAQLVLSIPAGTHLPFNTITAPRVTQAVADVDFEMEVKFDSLVTGSIKDQGVLILEDELNWLRFDFFSSGTNLNLFAASTVAGVSTSRFSTNLGATSSPTWMRINRTGNVWTLYYSLNGMGFTQAASFSFGLNVSEAGVYVGNSGPAHTMVVDYVFETSMPIVPEDGPVLGEIGRMLTVNTTGNGSVALSQDQPLYYCSETVQLIATPAPGWFFDQWNVDLTGSVNPETITMSADRTVTAVFVQAPLTVEFAAASQSVGEAAGATPITVNLSETSLVDVTVMYTVTGTATNPADYTITASPLVILAGQTSANLTLSPFDDMLVESSETVVVTLTGALNAALGATQVHTATLLDDDGAPLVSDDFNKCNLDSIWTLTDPQNDATLATIGAGTDNAQLVLSIPAGLHDPFNTITAPRVTQTVADVDFEMEVKFDSLVTGSTRDQGVLILEDELNWLRFDFFSSGTNLNLFAASTVAGVSTSRFFSNLGATSSPTWMRINRTGNVWTLYYSLNGMGFTQAASFSFGLNVSEAGVYVGNSGPAHTMIVDYVFETASPIVPEDGPVIGEIGRMLTISTVGNGVVTQNPNEPLYYCSGDVELTAVPAPGWMFDRWEADLAGSVNPETITMSADRMVTAVFVVDITPPILTNLTVMPFAESALITWTTQEPATSVVDFGIGNLLQQESDLTLTLSHAITLTGLLPGTEYQFQATSADSLEQAASSAVEMFTTGVLGDFASDDFNHPNLDLGTWTLVDPLGGGDLRMVGSGTADAQLVLVAPGGGEEYVPWVINDSVRAMQPATDGDMQIEAKFETDLDTLGQIIGIAVEESSGTWIRFDFNFDGANITAFAAGITGSVVQVTSLGAVATGSLAANTPIYMRVRRVGDSWTQEYSFDGANWTAVNSFVHGLTVNQVGTFAGNEGSNPPQTELVVDYFINTADVLGPEDSGVPTDVTAPYVYRIDGQAMGENSVHLAWSTDEPAGGTLNYGLTAAFELGAYDTYPLAYSHDVVVSGLAPDTLYYFELVSNDGMANQVTVAGPALMTYPFGFTGFPEIDVWYGEVEMGGDLVQRFGHLGEVQAFANILGNVRDLDGTVASLTYQLNGGVIRSLSVGLNRFPWRLSQNGDFNIEINTDDLLVGPNNVIIRATDNEAQVTSMLVRVDFTTGVLWPQNTSIDWSTETDLMDAVQVVDGKWAIENDPAYPGEKVARTVEYGYDRILNLGDVTWGDYEVNFEMTAHSLDPDGFTAASNSHAIGFILRWNGHAPIGLQRPQVGFLPFGAVFTYRWFTMSERWDHYGTNFTPNIARFTNPVQLGVRYLVKAQGETLPNNSRAYRMRIWERGQPEPATWLYDVVHAIGSGPDSGSFLMFANHVDASFGNVTVTSLP